VKVALAPHRTTVFIALRQLWERKLLNGIAVGGVTLGVLVLIAMNGIVKGFEDKFTETILKISPHVILFDTELRPGEPFLQRYMGTLVAAHVAHESPSERQSRVKRPYEIVRALHSVPEVEAAAPSLAGMALLDFGGKTKSVDLRGIDVARISTRTATGSSSARGSPATSDFTSATRSTPLPPAASRAT